MNEPLDGWPDLMTPGEATAALGYRDQKSVGRLARLGRIRSLRLPGGHRRYWTEDVHKVREAMRQP